MASGRRGFLRLAGGGLAATAALGALPATVRKAMAIPANNATGFHKGRGACGDLHAGEPRLRSLLRRVEWGSRLRRPAADAVAGRPNGVAPAEPRACGRLRHAVPRGLEEHDAFAVDGSDQGHQAATTIVNGGRYDQWGASGELHKRMVYHTASDLPYYHALASAFTICDALSLPLP